MRLEKENIRAPGILSSSVVLDRYMCLRVVGSRADLSASIPTEGLTGWEKHQSSGGKRTPSLYWWMGTSAGSSKQPTEAP